MNKIITMSAAPRCGRLAVIGLVLMMALGLMPALSGSSSGTAFAATARHADLVDLNSASLEEVLSLPIPEEVARQIVDYRTYLRYFDNVFELMEVAGMTATIFQELKPLVATIPPQDEDPSIARLSASYRQVQRYLGQEGSSEGLANEYLNRLRNPENLNDMDIWDIMSYQNVSPVDATNIIKARDRLGRLESGRQLRGAQGLRYFAYRNLRDFVVYSEAEKEAESSGAVSGYLQTRYWETPFSNGDSELSLQAYNSAQVNPAFPPGWMNKAQVNIKGGFQVGMLTSQEYGELNWDETVKGYVSVSDRKFGDFRLKSAVAGNFRVAYGLGLIMDNTDYIHFRKTGFGFNKRLLGVHGDLSRSYQYTLKGAAAEGNYGPINASVFVSSEEKAGILNPDGTINRYITMRPRSNNAFLADRLDPLASVPLNSELWTDAFQEDMIGGNIKVMLAPGTFIGVTGYEARYNRGFAANDTTLLLRNSEWNTIQANEARNSELRAGYTSVYIDENGDRQEARFRRILGAEAQAVYGNVSLQAEYAFMQNPQNSLFSSKNPDAYIINAFSQWNNLHFLAIYRDYDLGFDNPYGRAFSNDSKYEMSAIDAYYRLKDPLYAWLESEGAQPKAEKGLFLETRYRISRKLVLSGLQFDKWQRKADGSDLTRVTIKGEYQPIFNLRFRVRQRYSSRSEIDINDVRRFQSWETRWQMIGLLSNYNRVQLMYMTSNVMFPPRGRLGFPAEPGPEGSVVGTNGAPSSAFEVRYEHNVTPGLKLQFASSVYNGFFWNFEGNEFLLLDGNGFRNWFKVESRVSERLLFQLKVTRDHNMPRTVDVRLYGDVLGNEPDADYVPKDQTTVRLQMDYTF